MADELYSLGTERGGGNEHTLSSSQTNKAANKALHIGTTHLVARRVSFRLNINAVKAQSILIDDAIDASIARTAKLCGSILMCNSGSRWRLVGCTGSYVLGRLEFAN